MTKETLEQRPSCESSSVDREDTGTAWTSVGLMFVVAVALLVGSLLLPAKAPLLMADTTENWTNFAARCLRDIFQAAGVVCAAIGVAAFFPRLGLWIEGIVLRSSLRKFLAVTIGVSVLSSGLFAYFVMDHMTHVPDETSMLFQAQVLASGSLYAKAPPIPEAFDFEFIIADPPRWYGKYFIGQSLFLVPGVWLGMPWLMHPLLIGVCVWLTYLLGRELLNEKMARVATVLMAFSPMRLYVGGTMMGHASSMLMLLVFALAVVKLVKNPARWGWGLIAGFFLGMACNARPLTALGLAGGIGIAALVALPWRRLNWRTVAAFSLALGLWTGVFFAYNKALTGDAFLTPFNKWSPNDRLGFGPDVGLEYWPKYDKGHSLRRGLLVDAYFNFDALGPTLTGWGHVTLLLLLMPIVLRRWRKVGWALSAAWLSLALIHVFHVSSGVLMGQPRYWSEAMPEMILLVAISVAMVRGVMPRLCRMLGLLPAVRTGRSAAWLAGTVMVVLSFYIGHWWLIKIYDVWILNPNGTRPSELAKEQQIDNALVFMKSGSYRTQARSGSVDVYPSVFVLNSPDLDTPVVYARDLGPAKNAQLAKYFPGRKLYWLGKSKEQLGALQFIPLEKVQSLPAP